MQQASQIPHNLAIRQNAKQWPYHPALLFQQQHTWLEISWQSMLKQIDQLANALLKEQIPAQPVVPYSLIINRNGALQILRSYNRHQCAALHKTASLNSAILLMMRKFKSSLLATTTI